MARRAASTGRVGGRIKEEGTHPWGRKLQPSVLGVEWLVNFFFTCIRSIRMHVTYGLEYRS